VNIIADEGVDAQIVSALRSAGHPVLYVAELAPGISDEDVLGRSRRSGSLLLTADKDFGELVFRQRLLHSGILLIRLGGVSPDEKARLVASVVAEYGLKLEGSFAVLTPHSFRIRRPARI
jgi:predicted nuclease of predicted toxin-antitoxin system